MIACYQFKDQNILEHGQSVARYFKDLYEHLKSGKGLELEWKLPEWVDQIKLDDLLDFDTINTYLVYHDCGKPLCKTIDEQGKQHFPDHAQVSYRRWLEYSSDQQVARLILMDMDAHTLCLDQADEFKSRPECKTLLLAALCELHSNAQMFGGLDSTSFKIKYKKLNRLAKRCLN